MANSKPNPLVTSFEIKCNDEGGPYKACSDQSKHYEEMKAKAAKAGRKLVVIVGNNYCARCRALEQDMQSSMFKDLMVIHIAVNARGQTDQSGRTIYNSLLTQGQSKMFPSIFVLDPKDSSRKSVDFRNFFRNKHTDREALLKALQ